MSAEVLQEILEIPIIHPGNPGVHTRRGILDKTRSKIGSLKAKHRLVMLIRHPVNPLSEFIAVWLIKLSP
jgi:hypothetical protein